MREMEKLVRRIELFGIIFIPGLVVLVLGSKVMVSSLFQIYKMYDEIIKMLMDDNMWTYALYVVQDAKRAIMNVVLSSVVISVFTATFLLTLCLVLIVEFGKLE